jgi:hypothetical protein
VENLQKSAVEDDVNFCLSSAILLCRLAGGKTASELSAFEDGEVVQFHIACVCPNGIRFECAPQLSRFSLFSDGIDSPGLGHLVPISSKSCPWLAVARLRPGAARGFRISTRVSATSLFLEHRYLSLFSERGTLPVCRDSRVSGAAAYISKIVVGCALGN